MEKAKEKGPVYLLNILDENREERSFPVNLSRKRFRLVQERTRKPVSCGISRKIGNLG